MAPRDRPSGAPATALPDGLLWRRAQQQVATRLGAFPGDRVAVVAPAGRDPTAHLSERLPRVRFLRLDDPFAHPFDPVERAPGDRLVADATAPPFDTGTVEAVVLLFAVPRHDAAHHEALVEAWAPVLSPFGRWHELVAVDGPRDPRLKQAEDHLRAAGFEKVRTLRLALGRAGAALFLLQGRWPGLDEDDLDDGDECDDDLNDDKEE